MAPAQEPARNRSTAFLVLRAALTALGLASLVWLPAAAASRYVPVTQTYPLTWEQWVHLEGVVDVAGPRRDRALFAMAAGRLYAVAPDGAVAPFADGPGGYAGPVEAEPYMLLVPDLPVAPTQPAGCAFASGDLFVLDLAAPPGLIRVDPSGRAARFADLPEVDWLFGLALDTVGRFDYRLSSPARTPTTPSSWLSTAWVATPSSPTSLPSSRAASRSRRRPLAPTAATSSHRMS